LKSAKRPKSESPKVRNCGFKNGAASNYTKSRSKSGGFCEIYLQTPKIMRTFALSKIEVEFTGRPEKKFSLGSAQKIPGQTAKRKPKWRRGKSLTNY